MLRLTLIGILLTLGLLIVADRARHHEAAHPAVPQAVGRRIIAAPVIPPPPPRQLVVAPPPSTDVPSPGMPPVDLLARLAIRRRLDREGGRVYLDSLLVHTDSILARWPDRSDPTLTVAFVADTSVAGWTSAAIDDARIGMHRWDGNEAGLRLREITGSDSADIRVRWVSTLSDPRQVGLTSLSWGPDGVVHSAIVTLALRRNTDSVLVPSIIRQQVAAHEFGHALGLPHSDSPNDVMFATSPVAGPSRRDQATLLLLYAVAPGSLKTPP